MPNRIRQKNRFGTELGIFVLHTGKTYKDIAREAQVNYSTLLESTVGRCAGHELIPKVRRYMADYNARTQARMS